MAKITILLLINFILTVVAIVLVKKSRLSNDAKTLLYIASFMAPVIALIIFAFLTPKNENSNIQQV